MATVTNIQSCLGTSLKTLVKGFVLTKLTEDKSPRTVEFYQENLKRFLWYAEKENWPDDVRYLQMTRDIVYCSWIDYKYSL